MIKGKILVELDYCSNYDSEYGDSLVEVIFKHPDLIGSLSLKSNSETLAKIQLEHLKSKSAEGSVGDLVDSIAKLKNRCKEAIELIKK